MVAAVTTVGIKQDDGTTAQQNVAYIYVGPGYFNDLYPIVGPSSDVKTWVKVKNFVDVVVEELTETDDTGAIANGDTVNVAINKINNNLTAIESKIPTKTSDLTNDGEGETTTVKDFINDYTAYQFVSRDSVKNYIDNLNVDDIDEIRQALADLTTKVDEALAAIDEKFKLYYTKEEIDTLLESYLTQIQIGDKDGGVVLSASSTAISSSALWDQIKDASNDDISAIADAAASTALTRANEYTDSQLSQFVTITYRGPYDSYADLITANPTGKAGVIYLVSHNHNDSDSFDDTDSDIFDEYIWITSDDGSGSFEKVGNTDVKLTDYLRATLQEDTTGVLEGDEGAVSKVEIVEDPVGSGNKVFKVTYKTIVKQETADAGKVVVGFQNGALVSTALVDVPLAGIAASTTSTITDTTTLGEAVRNLEAQVAAANGVHSVDIGTEGGLVVSGGPITNEGTLIVTHADRATESSAAASTVGDASIRQFIKQIALDRYGHIVNVESSEESYASGSTFTSAKDSITLSIGGEGPNFTTFSAELRSVPALTLTQTDDDDDFLVFYCGTSTVLASSVETDYS